MAARDSSAQSKAAARFVGDGDGEAEPGDVAVVEQPVGRGGVADALALEAVRIVCDLEPAADVPTGIHRTYGVERRGRLTRAACRHRAQRDESGGDPAAWGGFSGSPTQDRTTQRSIINERMGFLS